MNAPARNLPTGIHDGVPMDDYLMMRGFSASKAHTLLRYSPFHALHGISKDPSEASETGTAIHDALLEGIDRIVRIEADSWRTKAAKEAREEARAGGAIPLLAHKADAVEAAVTAAKAHIEASPLSGIFERGRPEQTIVWQEGEITCKARPDWLTDERDVLMHIKTTKGSARPEAWIRTQLDAMGYDLACAFYERGLDHFQDADSCEHVFLVIEQQAPYGCSLVGLSPALWDIAHGKVDRAIRAWQQCRATGKYPAYSTDIHYAEPTSWQMAHEEEETLAQSFTEEELKDGIPL